MEFIKPGTNIDFVGKRKYAFAFSIILVLITIGSLISHGGPNFGVDFAGGLLVQVAFEKPTTSDQIRSGLAQLGLGDASVQTFGDRDTNEFLIRAQEREGLELASLGTKIEEVLKKSLGEGDVDIRRVEMVGPKVGADLREKALLALFVAILFIAIYISGRFQAKWFMAAVMAGALGLVSYLTLIGGLGLTLMIVIAITVTLGLCWFLRLRYALGAVLALIHDVTITVGIFSITGKEFTLPVVAALLAIIGYSLNDTIIVFDRIRETVLKSGRMNFGKVLNRAINDTLSRTLLTSLTTLLVVFSLLFLGGGVIHDFAFALVIGVLVGTYSSIFVASPVLMLFPDQRQVKASPEAARAKAKTPKEAAAPSPAAKSGPKTKNNKKKKKKKKN